MQEERIDCRTEMMGGKPIVRGTRLTVAQILQECAAGLTAAEVVRNHPSIEEEDVAAALRYAADRVRTRPL